MSFEVDDGLDGDLVVAEELAQLGGIHRSELFNTRDPATGEQGLVGDVQVQRVAGGLASGGADPAAVGGLLDRRDPPRQLPQRGSIHPRINPTG